MRNLTIIFIVVLMFAACNHQKKVKCSECNGKGETTYNSTERMAVARCQIYFASHMRECAKCKKHTDDESSLCREARKELKSIMDESKEQPAKMITEKCWICNGSGTVIEE